MPRSATTRTTPEAGAGIRVLRTVECVVLGALFLGAITMLSLPAARGVSATLGWMPLWLAGLPAASLATAFALRVSRRRRAERPSPTRRLRRPAAGAFAHRRAGASRRTPRLLAAIVLR